MCIALITPTGGRSRQIRFCAEFMHKQDYPGQVLWVVVDDCEPVTTDVITKDFRENWIIRKIYPEKKWRPGLNTQSQNLMHGIEAVKEYEVEAIFIIEDDDYYSSRYLSEMMKRLRGYDIAGEQKTIYYNAKIHTWFANGNTRHASLFQVAFTPLLLPMFQDICYKRVKFIDIIFFKSAAQAGNKINLFNSEHLSIGIKGLSGRAGIGWGHRRNNSRMKADEELVKLKELTGADYKYYI